jgi:hypothetical protein
MSQLIVPIPPDFELNLHNFMKLRGIPHETEAIIIAVKESLERARHTISDTTPGSKAMIYNDQFKGKKTCLTIKYY